MQSRPATLVRRLKAVRPVQQQSASWRRRKKYWSKRNKKLAVMVDTFHPLQLTVDALSIENEGYVMSWAE